MVTTRRKEDSSLAIQFFFLPDFFFLLHKKSRLGASEQKWPKHAYIILNSSICSFSTSCFVRAVVRPHIQLTLGRSAKCQLTRENLFSRASSRPNGDWRRETRSEGEEERKARGERRKGGGEGRVTTSVDYGCLCSVCVNSCEAHIFRFLLPGSRIQKSIFEF